MEQATVTDELSKISYRPLSDDEMRAVRQKLLDAGGDYAKAGVTLEELRNAVYTKALRVNPNVEAEDAAAKAKKEKKPRAKKVDAARGPTLTGDAMNDLLG